MRSTTSRTQKWWCFAIVVMFCAILPGCTKTRDQPRSTDHIDDFSGRHHGIFARATERQIAALTLAQDALFNGNADLAKRQLRELSASDEESLARASGIILLADILSREGQTLEANNMLVQLRDNSPPWAPLHYAIGLNALRAGRDHVALEAFTNALRADPTALRVYPGLAALHEEMGEDSASEEVMIRYERTIYLLADRLRDARSEAEQIAILGTLGDAPRDTRISRILVDHAKSDSWRTQEAALNALRGAGTSDAVPALRALVTETSSAQVRALARQVGRELSEL